MKNSTKGAIAAAAAGVLLLGGAGTLAYWTDTASVDGTTINSGHLKLDASACNSAAWQLDGPTPYTNQKLVPGDTLTKNCNVVIDAAGAHFNNVDLTVTAPTDVTGAAALIDELSATVTVNGGTANDVPVTVDGTTNLPVAITITWPYGSEDNDSNVLAGLSATLDAITVKAQQDHLESH
jgi:alternate signal-mediated exported protein